LSFANNVINTFLIKIVIFILTFSSGILSARILGPNGKGILTLVFLAPPLTLALGNLGIGIANVYLIGKKEFQLSDIVSNSFLISILFGGAGMFFSYIAIKFAFHSTFKDATDKEIITALSTIPAQYFILYGSAVLSGTLNIKRYNIVFLIQTAMLFCFFLCFLVLLKKGLYSAIVSQTLSIFIASVLCSLFVLKLARIKLTLNCQLLWRSLSFGLKGYLSNMFKFLNLRLDLFLVSFYLGAKEVGIYSVAAGIAEFMLYIPDAVKLTLYPTVVSSSSDETSSYLTAKVCRQVFLAGILSSIALFFSARLIIIPFYGIQFESSILPLKILLPGVICLGISNLLYSDLWGRGKPIISTYSTLTGLIATILADITLIPKFGIQGAALASTIAYFAMSIIPIWFFVRHTKRKVRDLFIFNPGDWQIYKAVLHDIAKRLS